MLTFERHSNILKLLEKKEHIKLQEIVSLLDVSIATVRRDFLELENQGKLLRVHGGAILPKLKEYNMEIKSQLNIEAKKIIAKKAVKYIEDGDIIYLDAGTTIGFIIPHLKNKKVTVITNGISHIKELLLYGVPTYIIGGKVKEITSALVGFDAVNSLKNYNFNKAFIGVNTVNERGYSTPDQEEALVKKMAISNAKKVFFLCDTSKKNQESLVTFATLEEGILIDELN